jgi:transcriptional regulator with XRE-family HTH domain
VEPNGIDSTVITRLRRNAGLTTPELADLAGVARNTMWRIQNVAGYTPRESTLRRIAAALDVPVGAFYYAPSKRRRGNAAKSRGAVA